MGERGRRPDRDRAVETALNYAILLGVATVLMSTLVFGVSGVVNDQQERAVRAQLETVGNRLAVDVGAVDNLARPGGATEASVAADLPARAAGARYTVAVESVGGDRYRLVLASTDPEVTVRVPFAARTPVAETTVRGGPLVVEYDGSSVVVRGG
jgi:hypothetical protein